MTKEDLPTSFLSRAECNVMRGLAILIIVLNNFTHCLKGVILDNEYDFVWSRVERFLNNLSNPNGLLPFNILSFFCPYGVVLFIFLSGYGLTLKYEKGNGQGVSHKDFVVNHYNKLFGMQVKGLALFLAVVFLCHSKVALEGLHVFLQAALVGNLNPYQSIDPGPYWFFGMIMEMYVIYRLFIHQRKDLVLVALIVLSLIGMAIAGPSGDIAIYLRINCFMAIMPFCMGVLAARHLNSNFLFIQKGGVCLGWFVLSFILLILCKFNFYSWLLLPVFIIATAVTIVKLMCRVKLLDGVFGWLGALSGVLFVVHPSVREMILANDLSGNYYSAVVYYLLITFGLCIILRPAFSSKKK